jgi:hypothetical protein
MVYGEAVKVMPWVLSYFTRTMLWVCYLMFACRNCGAVANGLLYVYFFCDVYGVG